MNTKSIVRSRHRRERCAAFLVLAMVGCGGHADVRIDISGPVTWKGQPVPAGFVVFNPNVAEGNIGAQGMAPISNGRYDTRAKGGRPVAPGSLLVSIHGFDGVGVDEERRNGKRLFVPAEITVKTSEDAGDVALVVPEDVEVIP